VPTVATPTIIQDPGYLYLAPVGTAFPSGTASGSKFTDAPSVTWVEVGATESGSTFKYNPNVEAVSVAEFLDPVLWRTTSRESSIAFNLASYTLNNFYRAMNGGTLSTVSGSGATLISKYVPPTLGAEIRQACYWESYDSTMRIFFYRVLNVADVTSAFAKAPAYAVLPCEFRCEVDSSGNTFEVYSAGPTRLGT
jgi:hypothetical protein